MRLLFLLLLTPLAAQAQQTCYFYPQCDARINVAALQSQIASVSPSSELREHECATWNSYPYVGETPAHLRAQDIPSDPSLPWSEPRAIEVSNVPAGVTCVQVRNFLQNHNPTETTEEEALRKRVERLSSAISQTQTIQDILTRLNALEGQP